MRTAAILVAAGPGTRLGGGVPKAFVKVAGVPLVIRAARALLTAPAIASLTVVVPKTWRQASRKLLDGAGPWRIPVDLVEGGAERQDSVRAGLAAVTHADLVVVHDAARPFVSAGIIQAAIEAAGLHGAAIVAVPASDTVKEINDGTIERTLSRERIWLAQTPQVFRLDLIRTAHGRAQADGVVATDDSALVERLGVPVYVVRGTPENRKITTPDDLRWAEWYLSTLTLR